MPGRQRSAVHRSLIAVPLLRENELVGAIFAVVRTVRPFTDKQIESASEPSPTRP